MSYFPQHTNKTYIDHQNYYTKNDGLRKVETNMSKIKEIGTNGSTTAASATGFFTKKTIIICISAIILGLLIVGAITAGVIIGTRTNSNSDTNSTGSNDSSATTAINSSGIPNPCRSNGALWSTTGTNILTTSQISSFLPNGLHIDSNNTLYVADESNAVVWKLVYGATTPTIVAGVYQSASSSTNRLNSPHGVYVDSSGNIYVSDYQNHRVQKFPTGSTAGTSATTIAGVTGSISSNLAYLYYPRFITVDSNETFIYIADHYNHRIVRYSTSSTSGTSGVLAAGTTSSAGNANTTLYYPYGVYISNSVGNDLFITNPNGYSVIRWKPTASSGYFVAGVPGTSGQTPVLLNYPTDVKIDSYGNMYVCDYSNHRIQLFCANSQTASTIAGTGISGGSSLQLSNPKFIAFDSYMNLYVSDYSNRRIQMFTKL